MSAELQLLGYSALLGFVQIILASHSASLQRGYRWAAGAREEAVAPLTGAAVAGNVMRGDTCAHVRLRMAKESRMARLWLLALLVASFGANAIVIRDDVDLRIQLGAAARERALSHFTPEVVAPAFASALCAARR